MDHSRIILAAAACSFAIPAWLPAQTLKPQTVQDFECYVTSAEARMAQRKAFLLSDSDASLAQQVVRDKKIQTVPGGGANPHKVTGAMVYDWIGTVFIPGTSLDRTIRMLQDYDHRPQYFPEIVGSGKLMCRTGADRFGFTMRLKEPAVIDATSDVVWERIDAHRAKCRSYSTHIKEIGKEHNYLLRLNSYWRFLETDKGVIVEGQTIELSGEFGSLTRALGSMMGINPEKSLKKTLTEMRETLLKPGIDFPAAAAGLPDCGEAVRLPVCGVSAAR